MPLIGPYHRARQRAEVAMAAQAASSVATIAHYKLAALHGRSAKLAEARAAHAGKSPLSASEPVIL